MRHSLSIPANKINPLPLHNRPYAGLKKGHFAEGKANGGDGSLHKNLERDRAGLARAAVAVLSTVAVLAAVAGAVVSSDTVVGSEILTDKVYVVRQDLISFSYADGEIVCSTEAYVAYLPCSGNCPALMESGDIPPPWRDVAGAMCWSGDGNSVLVSIAHRSGIRPKEGATRPSPSLFG